MSGSGPRDGVGMSTRWGSDDPGTEWDGEVLDTGIPRNWMTTRLDYVVNWARRNSRIAATRMELHISIPMDDMRLR